MEQNWFEFDPQNERIAVAIPGKRPLIIAKDDLDMSFFSEGHGGQNVNRHMNGVRLIYRIPSEYQLPFKKTKQIISKCITQRHREQNFEEALEHLAEKIRAYFYQPPHRTKTKPTKASKQKRIDEKKRHGAIKMDRKKVEY